MGRAARVVHVKKDEYDLYIGRPNHSAGFPGSEWANPFRIGDPRPLTARPMDRADAVSLYEEWILVGGGQRLLSRLNELEGRILGCWCSPRGGLGAHDGRGMLCHGQVLLRLVERRGPKNYESGQERYIFCGSRAWSHSGSIRKALSNLPVNPQTIVVTGGARGADRVAEVEASKLGLAVEVYEAEWGCYGKRAGFLRNETMLCLSGVRGVHAFRAPGESAGTDHMVRISREAGLPGRLVRERG